MAMLNNQMVNPHEISMHTSRCFFIMIFKLFHPQTFQPRCTLAYQRVSHPIENAWFISYPPVI
jgi:hypothetical protein